MSGMELNKLMAAVLVAGIVASLSGFIARETLHPHALHENAVKIEGVEDAATGGTGAPAMPEPILAMIEGADATRGETVAKACTTCHTFEKGGADGTGPNLWSVLGRDKGSKSGFDYSDGMEQKPGNWDYAELNHFLWKPKAFVEGTKMNFIGVKKPEDRAALIAWLRSKADAPRPLPSKGDIAAEEAALAPPEAAEKAPKEEGKAEEGKKEAAKKEAVEPAAGH